MRNGEFIVSTQQFFFQYSEERTIFDFKFYLYSPQLEVDKTIEEGVYIIPLRNTTHQPCVYNTVILVDNVTDFQLCFSFLHTEL